MRHKCRLPRESRQAASIEAFDSHLAQQWPAFPRQLVSPCASVSLCNCAVREQPLKFRSSVNWSQSGDTQIVRTMRVLIQDEACVAFQCKGSDTVASLKYAIEKELGMTQDNGVSQIVQCCLYLSCCVLFNAKENDFLD